MAKFLGSRAALVALPFLTLLGGCNFFSLSDSEEEDKPGKAGTGGTTMTTGGTGGSSVSGSGGSLSVGGGTPGGAAGSSAGVGGTGTAGAGAGGTDAAGASGSAGSSLGGSAGSESAGTGGQGGDAGSSATAGAGAGGTAGAAGSAGSAGSGGNPNPPESCEELNAGSVEHDGHCYLRVSSAISWRTAQSACRALDAHLVSISSEGRTQQQFDDENAFVWQLAGMMDVWIGATDGKQDNQMGDGTPSTWENGEEMVLDNWGDGEPNNQRKDCDGGGDCYEHCGFMWQERSGEWNDELCSVMKQYVCEWDSLE